MNKPASNVLDEVEAVRERATCWPWVTRAHLGEPHIVAGIRSPELAVFKRTDDAWAAVVSMNVTPWLLRVARQAVIACDAVPELTILRAVLESHGYPDDEPEHRALPPMPKPEGGAT